MPLPKDIDSIDIIILRAIARSPQITTREIEAVIYLGRGQVLRRLRTLRERGLIARHNGVPGQTYRYELDSSVTAEDIETANIERLQSSADPLAREALIIVLHSSQVITAELVKMTSSLQSLLK